ncbi:hypothetical protein HDU92_007530 [Lobulomyces angularis]|nr:hypothetical protein HDU92_007530 [Lobulomyces angularis]
MCNTYPASSVEICKTTYYGFPSPEWFILHDLCDLNPIPDEVFLKYRAKLLSNKIYFDSFPSSDPPDSPAYTEKIKPPLDYIVLFILAIFLAVFITRKVVENRKRTNQVSNPSLPSNVVIPLNERSLYYYQEEFGDEQLPKYCNDLEFQPSNENIPLQVLNSDVINTTTTAGLPTFEESQVSTGQSIDQGETLNELQQNENIGNVISDSNILVPATCQYQSISG